MILVTRFSALGDIAMTIPPLYDACRANPDKKFLMLTRKGPARLFINPPENLIVRGIDLDQYKGVPGLWRLASGLADEGVSFMIDLHDVLRTKLMRSFLRMRGIGGAVIEKGRAEKKRLTRADHKVVVPLKTSIERYRDTFRKAGLKMEHSFSNIFAPGVADPALFAAATPPKKEGQKWIGIAPFARHKGKIYPPELMVKALAEIQGQPDVKVFLFAAGPEEEPIAARWTEMFPGIVNLAPLKLGFEAEMGIMSYCDAVISMDSANMHLASLAGCRVVSIWGATHPYCGFMGFNQKEADTIQLDMSCRPCSVFGNLPCRRGDYLCLNGISPKRIVKSVGLALLGFLLMPGIASASTPSTFTPSFPSHPELPSPVMEEALSPESPEINSQLALRADEAMRAGDFQGAFALCRQVRPGRLPLADRAGYWYCYASATARLGLLDLTQMAAGNLKDQDGGETAGRFVEGYVAYRRGDFAEARELLSGVPPRFMPDAYLSQIELAEGNWRKSAEMAQNVAEMLKRNPDSVNRSLLPGMLYTAGIAYFKEGNPGRAKSLLEDYLEMAGEAAIPDAAYALAQIEYANNNPARARALLIPLIENENEIGQGARFTLAQIEAAGGNNREAALAFSRAAQLNYDPKIGQMAIYNYIAAGSNGASVPFASAAAMYENYLNAGSGGAHAEVLALRFARDYYREGNYAKALECVRRVESPDLATRQELRRILYQLGRQEVASGHYDRAIQHLSEALAVKGSDSRLSAECELWMGDAYYALGEFPKASGAYSRALKGLQGANRALAQYNYAYSLFSQDKFKDAAGAFRKVLNSSELPKNQLDDARLRLADSYFYTGNYREALRGYTEGSSTGNAADYASMRRAILLGLTGDVDGKLKLLSEFPKQFPNSRWQADAMLELGNTYAALDRQPEAAVAFARVSEHHPASPQARKATLAMAQSLLKSGDLAGAEKSYRRVISSWPSSEEALIANDDMLRLASANGALEEYAEFLRGIKGAPHIDSEKMEMLAFEAAEEAWSDDINDIARLQKYLADYPDGRYVAQALMDIGESHLEAGNMPEALSAFMRLESVGGADYAPEAFVGVMKSTSSAAQRAEYAAKVLAAGGVEPEAMELARLFNAIGMLDSKTSRQEGISILSEMATHRDMETGARAAVELGEWYLNNGRNSDALRLLSDFTDAGSPHAYWLARGFILLSDTYRKRGESGLADEYLRSLKANYPGTEPDILNAISSRLKK